MKFLNKNQIKFSSGQCKIVVGKNKKPQKRSAIIKNAKNSSKLLYKEQPERDRWSNKSSDSNAKTSKSFERIKNDIGTRESDANIQVFKRIKTSQDEIHRKMRYKVQFNCK